MLMKELLEEMEKDFLDALNELDIKYDPFSKKFMKALFIGQLWLSAKSLDGSANGDIGEELDGARKYLSLYQITGDVQYKEMASDELKHAGILIKKHQSKTEDKTALNELEEERQELLKKISVRE